MCGALALGSQWQLNGHSPELGQICSRHPLYKIQREMTVITLFFGSNYSPLEIGHTLFFYFLFFMLLLSEICITQIKPLFPFPLCHRSSRLYLSHFTVYDWQCPGENKFSGSFHSGRFFLYSENLQLSSNILSAWSKIFVDSFSALYCPRTWASTVWVNNIVYNDNWALVRQRIRSTVNVSPRKDSDNDCRSCETRKAS